MNCEILDNKIKIYSVDEFNPAHIFECGQVFAYKKIGEDFYVFYPNDRAYLVYKDQERDFFVIQQIGGSGKIEDAIELFDLNVSYSEIKKNIHNLMRDKNFRLNKEVIRKSLEFGYGIRILKQEIFETIISFVFSQNNNIKRIKNSLDRLRKTLGKEIKLDLSKIKNEEIINRLKDEKIFSFPKLNNLSEQNENFFTKLGAGYRAKYLVSLLKELEEIDLAKLREMGTKDLRRFLIGLKGIGRKVADCILLFGFNRENVFPVDTWVGQVYKDLTADTCNNSAIKISDILEEEFGDLSGYIQQYLFYFKRSFDIIK